MFWSQHSCLIIRIQYSFYLAACNIMNYRSFKDVQIMFFRLSWYAQYQLSGDSLVVEFNHLPQKKAKSLSCHSSCHEFEFPEPLECLFGTFRVHKLCTHNVMLLCILVAPVIIVLYTKAKFSSNHYLCTSVVLKHPIQWYCF